MNNAGKIAIPSIETALKDMQEYELIYKARVEKRTNLCVEIDKLKAQEQLLKADIRQQNKSIQYYEAQYIDQALKIENAEIDTNKARLMAASNAQKIKQLEAKIAARKRSPLTLVVDMEQQSKSRKENLLSKKEQLQERLAENNTKMDQVLGKLFIK